MLWISLTLHNHKTSYYLVCKLSKYMIWAVANINKLDRSMKRFAESVDTGERTVVKRKIGRPSLTEEMAGNDYQSLKSLITRAHVCFWIYRKTMLPTNNFTFQVEEDSSVLVGYQNIYSPKSSLHDNFRILIKCPYIKNSIYAFIQIYDFLFCLTSISFFV